MLVKFHVPGLKWESFGESLLVVHGVVAYHVCRTLDRKQGRRHQGRSCRSFSGQRADKVRWRFGMYILL